MNWNYQREESDFELIPEGKHRVVIEDCEMTQSRTGNDMLKLVYQVSGYNSKLWDYIVFLEDRPHLTNRNLTQFFDCFGIAEGDFALINYMGKAGAVEVEHDDSYNGTLQARVKRRLKKEEQNDLPPWKEAGQSAPAQMAQPAIPDDNLPF